MNNNEYIVSLDIGTSKVRVIIGEINSGSINIIGVGTADSHGIKKGAIVDIDETVQAIREAVEKAERMVDLPIHHVVVGISGNHIQLQASQGVVAVSSENREIGDDDIERVMKAAQVIAIPPEREIIDVVPVQYIVDGLGEISDPRGMLGVRLEMEGTIITGSKTVIHNIMRCVERAGLSIVGMYLMPLASSEIALTKDEKNLGVVLVDIGAGSTTVSVFELGTLSAFSVLPIGGEYITNDIAIGLRTTTEEAKQIQTKSGCALVEEANEDERFHVKRIGSDVDKEFTQIELANIIEPRAAEIFELVEEELESLGYDATIPNGFVLTGGVASIPGLLELARYELQAPVRIAIPDYIGVRDPGYTAGVGLIKYASKYYMNQMPQQFEAKQSQPKAVRKQPAAPKASKEPKEQGGFVRKVKDWFSEFI
ncbi:cell division protein FtsA [Aneurinibacillus soli]|uniref:Cell division protein FtsA n=1 Tax=Aneurinibacillus soli TaxID=1500254 RepID=A0A0U4WFL5_9BACL|nr:cell division protein FtsA [Aneurinibacillus soli]PYE63570.1 cell division protein FtsA [Aneurinibacillus soli]BAU27497.1 Cell division protein FtsA [Aneurinibacillus soli]